jgi:hypothetical protein
MVMGADGHGVLIGTPRKGSDHISSVSGKGDDLIHIAPIGAVDGP